MVSLSRLLAAAEDSSAASAGALPPPRDCVLPPILPPDLIPQALRQASATPAPPSTSLSSLRPTPLLPLQRLLRDLGPDATAPSSMPALVSTLAHFGRPSEAAVASALLFLATAVPPEAATVDSNTMFQLFSLFCSDPDNPSSDPAVQHAVASSNSSPAQWRVDVLVKAVTSVAAQFNQPLDWRQIIRSLDVEALETQLTMSAFADIANAYMSATNGSRLPADCILSSWYHAAAQSCIISHALNAPTLINWDVLELFTGATPQDAESPYARVKLIERLVELGARELLQAAVKDNPEVVLLSLACAKPQNNSSLQQKLIITLLQPLIALYPASERALKQMWHVTPALVEVGIVSMWQKDPSTLQKALSIGIDMAILPQLLSKGGTAIEFAVELAMLAYQRNVLKFEAWLMEMLRSCGMKCIHSLTVHMAQKVSNRDPSPAGHLSLDALRIVFRCLITSVQSITGAPSSELMEAVNNVYETYCQFNPRMQDLQPSADVGNPKTLFGSDLPSTTAMRVPNVALPTSAPQGIASQQRQAQHQDPSGNSMSDAASTAAAILLPRSSGPEGGVTDFPEAVEKEADVFFGKLYKGDMSTDTAIEVLKKRKLSALRHEWQVFNCTMHTLFDEYRFFKRYPDRELKITGVLFGSVIQYSLLTGGLLGLAARCVLDALRTVEPAPQPVGRLAKFGLVALERFRSRLHEWPQYCASILQLHRLKELAPELLADVQKALDMNGAVIPSAAEQEIGISGVDREAPNEPVMTTEPGVPSSAYIRDAAADDESVRVLVASPPLSTNTTPLRARNTSHRSLLASPTSSSSAAVDTTLGMSPIDLTTLLGFTDEEASAVVAPDEATQDKIKFIFNNLSKSTMDDKVEEMLSILSQEYYSYFAIYTVVKRASSEANFHHLYIAMLDRMEPQAPSLYKLVFQTSFKRVRVLLGSHSTASSDRSILKSLGSWIGSLTLARDKPILRKDLDMKEALLDAFSKGRLTIVIPFVVKVLEKCKMSRIFKTTNPWVRGILSLMKELYGVQRLKLNMKFEVQILCKTLEVDTETITPSDLLKNCVEPKRENNPDFNTTKRSLNSSPTRASPMSSRSGRGPGFAPLNAAASGVTAPMFSLNEHHGPQATLQAPVSAAGAPQQPTSRIDMAAGLVPGSVSGLSADPVGDITSLLASAGLSSNAMSMMQNQRSAMQASMGISSVQHTNASLRQGAGISTADALFPNLAQYITVSPSLMLFRNNPSLKSLVPLAIERAIREIISPVVERSCAIAFLTTKELTLKDFANEPDVSKVRRAALQMVQQLAGSLALVTSKEPLRVSMGNQLRTILTPSLVADQTIIEQTAQVVCAANLDIGCAVIEKHAKEKAARDLNEKIGPAFATRRPQHSTYTGGPPGPEVLRVYEQFSLITRVGPLPVQYASAHQVNAPSSQGGYQSHAPIQPSMHNTGGLGNQAPARSMPNAVDPRGNGAKLNPQQDSRLGIPPGNPRVVGSKSIRNDASTQMPAGGRVVVQQANQSNGVVSTPHSGSPLPPIARHASLSVLLTFVGESPNANGPGSTQALNSVSDGSVPGEEVLSTQQVLERFNAVYPQVSQKISEAVVTMGSDVTLSQLPGDHEVLSLWTQIPAAVKRSVTADEAGMAVAQKVFQRLFEGDSSLYREVHVQLLEGLRESCRRLSRELSSWLAFSEDRKKFHKECIIALLKSGLLLNTTNYDEIVAKAIDKGQNLPALEFACFLINRAVIEEPLATAVEMGLTLDAMSKVSRRANPPSLVGAPDGLHSIVEKARSVVHKPKVSTHTSVDTHHPVPQKQPKENEPADPVGAREFIATILIEWHRLLTSESNRASVELGLSTFLTQVRMKVIDNEDTRERFFRLAIDVVTSASQYALRPDSYPSDVEMPADMIQCPYSAIEPSVRFFAALCRREASARPENNVRGLLTLCQFLVALVKDILKRSAGTDFRPHFRLLSGVLTELSIGSILKDQPKQDHFSEPSVVQKTLVDRLSHIVTKEDAIAFLDDKNDGFIDCVRNAFINNRNQWSANLDSIPVMTAIVCALTTCSPVIVPSFAFSWLQLISNKELLPTLLSPCNVNGWPLFCHLMVSMLRFLSRYLDDSQAPLTSSVSTLYNGLLRVLLVLLHDFPEFLCCYHMSICDEIPANCVQLRNLVLASFPKEMRLPDPFAPELDFNEIPEMLRPPTVLSSFSADLESCGLRSVVDGYLQNGAPFPGAPQPADFERYLTSTDATTGKTVFLTKRVGALVLYLGSFATSMTQGEPLSLNGPALDMLRSFSRFFTPEGQHYLFNAIANQLRYPNTHTLYFSNLLLLLFREAAQDVVKEQITRVLVERLLANRPHPWGLLITFVQLIKNPEYKFWTHSFVKCAPEIEQLFENVAKFCVGPTAPNKTQSVAASS